MIGILKKLITADTVHRYISKAYHAKYPGSRQYWDHRYEQGGTSGAGSYGRLAEFKSNTIEQIIDENDIETVLEFGCGDGNQLSRTDFPSYIGLDVSPAAIDLCTEKFRNDQSKSFFLYDPHSFVDNLGIFQAELSLSLDVIYHLTEDEIYQKYMEHLFSSSTRYVVIYSSNTSDTYPDADHVQHREFTNWVASNTDCWELGDVIENKYPYDPLDPETTSWSDFYIFEKSQ